MADLPSLESNPNLQMPVFVRSIDNKKLWDLQFLNTESPDLPAELFCSDGQGAVSLFYVRNDMDLRRVVIGLNSGRASLLANSFILPIPMSIIREANIEIVPTDGTTKCTSSNRLNFDAFAPNTEMWRQVIRRLKEQAM